MSHYDDDLAMAKYIWNVYRDLVPSRYFHYAKYVVYGRKDPERCKSEIGSEFEMMEKECSNYDLNGLMLHSSKYVRNLPNVTLDIQRCPSCNKITATPIAEQCSYCPHEWRGLNPKRKQWDDSQA